MIQQLDVAGGNMDQRIGVFPARLNQYDLDVWVLRQPVRQHASGRTSANNHNVDMTKHESTFKK